MTAVQLAAHIRTRRALGLQRTPMRMGVRSSVACIRSRPLCNTRAVPGGPIYKRFPVLCECLSRGRISAVTSGASSAKSPRVHALFFPLVRAGGRKKEKRKRRDGAERQKKKRRLPAASISIARLRLLKSAYLSQITLAGGLHVHFGGFLLKDDIKLLNSKTTIDPFFS